jgi:hypothetical protein
MFSLANINRGKIIACRSSRGQDAVGSNVVSYLGIDEDELAFISDKMGFGSDNIFFISRMGNVQRPAAILRFFSYSTQLALAVVFDLPIVAVSKNLRDGVVDFSCASERLLAIGERKSCSEQDIVDTYLYFSEFFGNIAPLYALRLQYSLPDREVIKGAAHGAAWFMGTDIDCLSLDLPIDDGYLDEVGNVFSGPMCAALLLLGAMLARDMAVDRKIDVKALWGYRSFYLRCSFKPIDRSDIGALDLLLNIADSRNVAMKSDYCDGCVQVDLLPFYCDMGIAEVKEHGGLTRLTDVEIKLYNYPGITLDVFRQ